MNYKLALLETFDSMERLLLAIINHANYSVRVRLNPGPAAPGSSVTWASGRFLSFDNKDHYVTGNCNHRLEDSRVTHYI